MMTKRTRIIFGLLVVIAAVAASCGKLQEKPVVDFMMKDFKLESSAGCIEFDSATCAAFEVEYPVFLSLDSNVRRSINERIIYILSGSDEKAKSLEQIGGDFIKDFEAFKKEAPDFDLSWYFDAQVDVMIASDSLISLRVDFESFTGGAHPTFTVKFINIDPMTGTAYLLDAMLRPGYEMELNRLAEEDLREQMALVPDDSASVADVPREALKLNDNYGFRKEGIVFYFNDDELLLSSTGSQTEILIPYEKLQDWIR